MIVRTGRRIPGVMPLAGVHAPISVVRMAVGRRLRRQGVARGRGRVRGRASGPSGSSAGICRAVSEYAFRLAERSNATVFGGPKYTVSPTYEGMLKEEMDAAAERHPRSRTGRS